MPILPRMTNPPGKGAGSGTLAQPTRSRNENAWNKRQLARCGDRFTRLGLCYHRPIDHCHMRARSITSKPMAILAYGVNYRTAPLEVRERIAFPADYMAEALHSLRTSVPTLSEAAIVSTCNRTELYAALDPAE